MGEIGTITIKKRLFHIESFTSRDVFGGRKEEDTRERVKRQE